MGIIKIRLPSLQLIVCSARFHTIAISDKELHCTICFQLTSTYELKVFTCTRFCWSTLNPTFNIFRPVRDACAAKLFLKKLIFNLYISLYFSFQVKFKTFLYKHVALVRNIIYVCTGVLSICINLFFYLVCHWPI